MENKKLKRKFTSQFKAQLVLEYLIQLSPTHTTKLKRQSWQLNHKKAQRIRKLVFHN